ncbi:MAG: DUF1570 domain-containing protein [Pirellulaceae bacterium]|nr:DUF1570 domain-containing protein [Pirellulaceae bacterium]
MAAPNVAARQTSAPVQSPDFNQLYADSRAVLRDQIQELVKTCNDQQMPAEAAEAKSWDILRDPNRQYIFRPPSRLSKLDESTASELQKSFQRRLKIIKQEHAERLFELAKLAADNERGPESYQWLHETLVYDPDHRAARKALGFRENPTLGWVRSAKPITARLSRTRQKIMGWEKGTFWEINSPHFKVYSAAGEDAGVALAEELENTYWVWRQVFFDYWSNARQIQRWLAGDGADKSSSKQYQVILFRDKQQYVTDLAAVDNIAISSGYYAEGKRASFFYWDAEPPIETWRHEIIHQLLQENAGVNKSVGDRGHAWWVEGIAMYFESMLERNHYVTLGGFDATRLQYARLRNQREGYFIPMIELDAMGRDDLQSNADIKRLYTQASGVSQYLMNGEAGKHRDGFLRLIKEFYKDRRFKSTLAERTLALDQLDRAYQEYLGFDREEFARYLARENPDVLALGRGGLQDKDITRLKGFRNLQWLELSNNPISDKALENLRGMSVLSRLFLDATRVTDKGLNDIVALTGLQELDLANTQITDAGIEKLTSMTELQILWLADTAVSDASIPQLAKLPKLKLVDLRLSKVTSAGVERLQRERPQLQILQ